MKRNIIAVMAFLIAASLNAKTEVTVYDLSAHPSVHNSGKPIVNHDGDDVTSVATPLLMMWISLSATNMVR